MIRRIYWSYGKPILLLGLTATAPYDVFHQLVHKYTALWGELKEVLDNYKPYFDQAFNSLHEFEELLEFLGDFCYYSDDETI